MYFSAENLPRVNPVVMNYKTTHSKTRPVKYSLVWPYRFSIIICGGRKTEKHGLDMRGRLRARVAMEESLLSV